MNCPHCDIPLMMTDRMGVEIDFCSKCRGVWLDRGELDKIIELSAQEQSGFRGDRARRPQSGEQYYQERPRAQHYNERSHYDKRYPKYKKKKSLMGEIFDIFD